MTSYVSQNISVLLSIAFSVIGLWLLLRFHIHVLRDHRTMAFICWAMEVIIVPSILSGPLHGSDSLLMSGLDRGDAWLMIWSRAILWVFLLPFCAWLYLKWVLGELSAAEKSEGMEGVRAWLCPNHVLWIIAICFCAWKGYGVAFFGVLALTLAALLAYPILTQLAQPQPAARVPGEDLTAERDKVLQLLEQGKITASESADLLNALAASVRAPAAPAAIPSYRRLIWAGAALVLLGFFLPWIVLNPGVEVQRLASQIEPGMPMNMNLTLPGLTTGTFNVNGPAINHGLGWVVLLAALVVGVLPSLVPDMDAKKRRLITQVTLGVGSLVMLSILSQNYRWISYGLCLCLAGYGVTFIGAAREWKTAGYAR